MSHVLSIVPLLVLGHYESYTIAVKVSPCMSQKWLRFGKDTNMCEFTKCTRQYDLQQRAKARAIIGKAIVCAASPPLLQTLAGYCRTITTTHQAPWVLSS